MMNKGTFLPSMIEVEFGDYYKSCAQFLFNEGFQSFHIDFGDGLLIGRELEPWDKVSFLKDLGTNIKLTAHIMCKSGSHSASVERITERCIKEGFDLIYVHPKSFRTYKHLERFKYLMFENSMQNFGVVSELEASKNVELVKFVKENSVENLLQMGVPIGRGGQSFGTDALDRINDLCDECKDLSIVELDGGLTFEVVKNLKDEKINRFAGWSLIAHHSPEKVKHKAIELRGYL